MRLKNLGPFAIFGLFGPFLRFSFFLIFGFLIYEFSNNDKDFSYTMYLKGYFKTFNLTTYDLALYDQSAPRYTRLKFYKKLSSSNQSEVYLKFCNVDSICTIKPFFSLNERFFPRPFI